ncbi:hypothetical protein HHI36_014100 [Cryptolaemus montrouzieri]|uniref:Uncharacterized protein n=1 Tax=Cryptolaemus montrouzieri TaxID=559131 RepID=A0ABD2N1T6_9CUCU
MKDVDQDKKKITLLTTLSNECLDQFHKKLRIVEHCQFLFNACKKFETTTENLNKWLSKEIGLKYPYIGLPRTQQTTPDSWEIRDDESVDDFFIEGTKLSSRVRTGELYFEGTKILIDTKKIINKIFPFKKPGAKRFSAPAKLQRRSGKIRPETAVSKKSKISSASRDIVSTDTPEKPGVSTLSKVVIQAKPSFSSSSPGSSFISEKITEEAEIDQSESYSDLDINLGHLGKFDNLWNLHNKVVVDIKELKEEKRNLMYENERLKALLRLILETAAIHGDVPEPDTASTTSSFRSSLSASFKTIFG